MTANVRSVTYYGGATAVEGYSSDWGGVTLGSYINMSRGHRADPNDALFQHEYGHYRQSQSVGPLYLVQYALPSLVSSLNNSDDVHDRHPSEQNANVRAYKYFRKHEAGVKWDDYNNPITGYNWDLDYNHPTNQNAMKIGKWWGYVPYPLIIILDLANITDLIK